MPRQLASLQIDDHTGIFSTHCWSKWTAAERQQQHVFMHDSYANLCAGQAAEAGAPPAKHPSCIPHAAPALQPPPSLQNRTRLAPQLDLTDIPMPHLQLYIPKQPDSTLMKGLHQRQPCMCHAKQRCQPSMKRCCAATSVVAPWETPQHLFLHCSWFMQPCTCEGHSNIS